MQQWYDEEFGPTGTVSGGAYAGKSYWLCTETWGDLYQNPSQNYPIDLDVYYNSGGFSNGYVPLFIVVGVQNKVYWDNNSSNFKASLRLAIDEMVAEGVYVDKPVVDKVLIFEETLDIDVSEIFVDLNGNPVTVTLDTISDPSITSVELNGAVLTITAGNTTAGTSTITIKGTAGEFSETDEFIVTVYDPATINIEDFETGDFTKFQWQHSGNSDWFVNTSYPYEGTYCTQSSDIGSNQSSEIFIDVDYTIDGNLFFWVKVSSEANYDYLRFYIDEVQKGSWSGTSAWNEASFPVTTGTHTFKWIYDKDSSGDVGDDCAWIDKITFKGGIPTSIENSELRIQNLELYQNYPNPFNPNTQITFSLDQADHIKLSVLNHAGQVVNTLVNKNMSKGIHNINFNALNLNSGIYFYTLETGETTITKKMILIK